MEPSNSENNRTLSRRAVWALLLLSFALYVLLMAGMAFAKYDQYDYNGYDLGIYSQAVWRISNGESPFISIRGVHLLGDHFTPVVYLAAPLYHLFPHPKTLLLLQTLALGSGVFPVFLLARHRFTSPYLALLFALIYLFYPAIQRVNLAEFHTDVFCVPALLVAQLCLDTRKWILFAIVLGIALMTKETVGTVLLVWGATILPRNRNVGLATMTTGFAGLIIANMVIQAHNGGQQTPYLWIYHQFGTTIPEILKNLLFNPALTWSVISTDLNRSVALQLFLPLAFLPFLRPVRLLPALPSLLCVILSSREWMHHIDQWSLCPAIPFLFDATLAAYKQISDALDQQNGRFASKLIPLNLLMMIVVGATNDPFLKLQRNRAFKHDTQSAFDRALSKIPPNCSTSAHAYFLPHLAARKTVYCFTYPFYRAGTDGSLLSLKQHDGQGLFEVTDAEIAQSIQQANTEYLLIGFANSSIMPKDSYLRLLSKLVCSNEYGLLEIAPDYMLFHRGDCGAGNRAKIEAFFGKSVSYESDLQRALSAWISH